MQYSIKHLLIAFVAVSIFLSLMSAFGVVSAVLISVLAGIAVGFVHRLKTRWIRYSLGERLMIFAAILITIYGLVIGIDAQLHPTRY